jgi:hypothetical protein
MSLCNFCNNSFANKYSLSRHLNDKKCKSEILNNWEALHNLLLESLQEPNKVQEVNVEPTQQSLQEPNDNLLVKTNRINELTIDHMQPEKMKEFIEKYSYGDLPLFFRQYIKDTITQNHSVKYITKNPPRINFLVENYNGKNINVIKNLKDSCELLSEPVLVTIKNKLNECLEKYDYFKIYRIINELNKECVKRVLHSILKNDILTDIEMKLK